MNDNYKPMMSEERAKKIREWHELALQDQTPKETVTVNYLDRTFVIPPDVFDPKPMSKLLGKSVLRDVTEADRVLDMGTGSGVNAILAASKSSDVVAVDISPAAIECAKHNAELNDVASRIDFHESDVFESVEGKFDLIIFDPPFRWFKPKDMRERATADENYQTLTAFFRQAKNYLKNDGRILMFFGSSGDIDYLEHLIQASGFKKQIMERAELEKGGWEVEYFAFKLTPASV